MFCGSDNTPRNITHINLDMKNILWNVVSLMEHCYETE